MTHKRVHILSAVNAANVSKSGDTYTVKDVVHAIDGIVLNRRLYTGAELAKSVAGLEGRPAPAGHPKDSKGRHISASNGEALSAAWIGAYCVNSRYEGGRALCDIVINAAQAQALPDGKTVIQRLDDAINGTNAEPIGVSSGLMLEEFAANGESMGKKYTSIAKNMQFDHLAILLNEAPAGTPAEGIGMFVNSEGNEAPVEVVNLELKPEDKRFTGLTGWIRKLLGNSDMSFDQIADGLRALIPDDAWVREVFPRYFVWVDYTTDKLYRQDYALSSDGSLALIGDRVEVIRKVEYEPIVNQEKEDIVKTHILAALNTAGIAVAGLDDNQLLTAYNALQVKPIEDKLIAANSKIAGFEMAANAAADAELTTLA
ncbi:MAG: hypothetical protein QE279_03525, partial [Rhodoferax sp.]|nr:hypothetical protein [Rhodoferax sp.]